MKRKSKEYQDCPHCGARASSHPYDKRFRGGVKVQRYQCYQCGKTFMERVK